MLKMDAHEHYANNSCVFVGGCFPLVLGKGMNLNLPHHYLYKNDSFLTCHGRWIRRVCVNEHIDNKSLSCQYNIFLLLKAEVIV